MLKKRENRYIVYLILVVAFISFILGIISLKSGFLRKTYDFFIAVQFDRNRLKNFDQFLKVDTIEITLSKKKIKNLYRLRSDSFLLVRNYINPNWQWIGERPWFDANLIFNSTNKKKVDIKYVGMNSDHFRDANNLSFRVNEGGDNYLYGYSKYNLLNPYSRGHLVDFYYNQLYRQNGGLFLDYRPIIVKFNHGYSFKLFEPFFSKDLIENNNYRDALILSLDKNDPEFLGHLKIVHPSKFSNLTKVQLRIYRYYDSIATYGNILTYFNINDLAFTTAVSINNGGDCHHNTGFNNFFYVDPVNGELRPFLREVTVFDPVAVSPNSYNIIKNDVYKKLGINKFTYPNIKHFDKLVDKVFLNIRSNDPIKFLSNVGLSANRIVGSILKNNFNARIYFDKILFPITKIPNKISSSVIEEERLIFDNSKILIDTVVVIPKNINLCFSPGLNLRLKNAALIVEGNVTTFGSDGKITIEGDSLSTIIFRSKKANLKNIDFKGFGNKINRLVNNLDVTSAITFVDGILDIRNCKFYGNYSGDDMLNLIRCDFVLDNLYVGDSKADALDIDAGIGEINNSKFYNAVNDGLDIGSAVVYLYNLEIKNCEDKAISIGEKSSVVIKKSNLEKNAIGIALKDGSDVSVYAGIYNENQVDFVAYGKKSKFDASVIKHLEIKDNFKYLVEPDVVFKGTQKIIRTKDIINLMYGKVYGKASVR